MIINDRDSRQFAKILDADSANIAFDISSIDSEKTIRFTTDDAQIFRDAGSNRYFITDHVNTVELLDDVQYFLRKNIEIYFNHDRAEI